MTHLKANILRTDGDSGIFMKRELVKYCKRRRASRLLGTLNAESLIERI
jgi:hypothetical protein